MIRNIKLAAAIIIIAIAALAHSNHPDDENSVELQSESSVRKEIKFVDENGFEDDADGGGQEQDDEDDNDEEEDGYCDGDPENTESEEEEGEQDEQEEDEEQQEDAAADDEDEDDDDDEDEDILPCSCAVFMSGQIRKNEPPTGYPALRHDVEKYFPCTTAGYKQCQTSCVRAIIKHLPNAADILCATLDRDCHKERAYLFVQNCNDDWHNTKLSGGKEYCCKDGEPVGC